MGGAFVALQLPPLATPDLGGAGVVSRRTPCATGDWWQPNPSGFLDSPISLPKSSRSCLICR